jgi:hypothetical protein
MPFVDIDKFDCTYCGVIAQSRDHIIPVVYESVSRKTASYARDKVVPACNECQGILSDRWIPTISGRAAYVAGELARKYAETLRVPDWQEQEIYTLGYNLQNEVRGALVCKQLITSRISFALVIAETQLKPEDIWDISKEDKLEIDRKVAKNKATMAISQKRQEELEMQRYKLKCVIKDQRDKFQITGSCFYVYKITNVRNEQYCVGISKTTGDLMYRLLDIDLSINSIEFLFASRVRSKAIEIVRGFEGDVNNTLIVGHFNTRRHED